MQCPICGQEMEEGKTFFQSMQGYGSMMMNFKPDDKKAKSQAWYCPVCKTLINLHPKS